MSVYTIWLMGSSAPLRVELDVQTVEEFAEYASRARFLVGRLAEPDSEGVFRSVLLPVSRLQCAFEAE